VATPGNYLFFNLVGLQLNWNIFGGFQRKYQLARARLNGEKLQNNLELLTQGIDLQTAQFRATLRNNLLAVQSQERNMALANTVLDLARKKYKAGVGSNIEVTQAQGDLLRAQSNYFTALLEVVNARTDLSKATGMLSLETSDVSDAGPIDSDRSGESPSNPGNISNPGRQGTNTDETDD
jgi:outer membrane protein TolC